MPLVKLHSSLEICDEKKKAIVDKIQETVKEIACKPRSYIMVIIEDQKTIHMGDKVSCALIEFSQLGKLDLGQKDELTARLSKISVDEGLATSTETYVVFQEFVRENWGHNGVTFASL